MFIVITDYVKKILTHYIHSVVYIIDVNISQRRGNNWENNSSELYTF